MQKVRRLENSQIQNKLKDDTYSSVGPVAQRLEQLTHNLLVAGSNPAGSTKAV